MDNSIERQELAQRITEELKKHWQFWNNQVGNKGYIATSEGKQYAFIVDRRTEDESLFTGDNVIILRVNNPLEDWTHVPKTLKTKEGETWIQVTVNPKDPYNPQLGAFGDNNPYSFYYTETLSIFLSNWGRAFEESVWGQVMRPDAHQPQAPWYLYLKRVPKPEEIQVKFTEEPEEVYTKPFSPLKGQNLERLDFLRTKARAGDIIEMHK